MSAGGGEMVFPERSDVSSHRATRPLDGGPIPTEAPTE